MDIERGKMTGMADELWQTDDSVATNSWCWVEGLKLKDTQKLVHDKKQLVVDTSGMSAANAPCKYAYSLKLVDFEVDVQPDAVKQAPKTDMVHD